MLNYMIVVNDGDELKTVDMLTMVENDQLFAEVLDEKLNNILDARTFAETEKTDDQK